jgi:hypothetical protein
MKIEFDFPEELAIRRGNGTFILRIAEYPDNIKASMLSKAFIDVIGDAAAGALNAVGLAKGDTPNESQAREMSAWSTNAMEKRAEPLKRGEWTQRRESAGDPLGELRAYVRAIIRPKVKALDAYKNADDKNEFLDTVFEKQSDEKRQEILTEARDECEKDKAKAAKLANIKLDMNI